jgi:hypothetical protein
MKMRLRKDVRCLVQFYVMLLADMLGFVAGASDANNMLFIKLRRVGDE